MVLAAVDHDRSLKAGYDPLGHLPGAIRFRYGWQQHRKLIATKPGDAVVFADAFGEAFAHNSQQSITGAVARSVIDTLELVQINIQQAAKPLGALAPRRPRRRRVPRTAAGSAIQ